MKDKEENIKVVQEPILLVGIKPNKLTKNFYRMFTIIKSVRKKNCNGEKN